MNEQKFLSAGSYMPPSIGEMETQWQGFAAGFNAIAEQGAFPFRLHVSIYQEELLLTVLDLERSYADTLAVQSRFGVRHNLEGFSYTLTCEVEPGVQDCFEFPATPADAERLRKRCFGEILAAVGPEQGTAFLIAQGKNPPDGAAPGVIH